VDEAFDTCPACHAAVPWHEGSARLADSDVTRLAASAATMSGNDAVYDGRPSDAFSPPPKPLSSNSGWLTSTDAIDHGRFAPGAVLDGRYRIIERAGRGGMGEVYRADDLKLAQPVALKFLPEAVDRDAVRLSQLHAEVRMARQVSHPNVCRVYDVEGFEGHTFLAMEYVDGEDLASLLRRIGRFPQERAIELARQICAGLAAAHDRGVVHRDLKPANIMLDGSGRIRITDFGLAGVAGETLRAGTPAYMAPEQLAGKEVTPRSDIYALGLVLYELFTGRRAVDAGNLADLIARREHAALTPPTAIVRDLDPGIERVILRCLDTAPSRRPASALAVAAALPGGDPLAAALAAGETPSPEMVAAAGRTEGLPRAIVVAHVAWITIAVIAFVLLYQRVGMINRVSLPKPPAALQDRVEEIVARLGYRDGIAATAAGIGTDLDWARYIQATRTDAGRWGLLSGTRPLTVVFWYRTSPRALVPVGAENNVSGLNPPLTVSGMTLAVVDAAGHLNEFHAVPEPTQTEHAPGPTRWGDLFDAAGLRMDAFKETPPYWIPLVYADERKAWEGHLPERPDETVRVEAAAYAGRPVFFSVTGQWDHSARGPQTALSRFNALIESIANLVIPGLMVLGAVLARKNLQSGRGDRRGAFRAASVIFLISLAGWALNASHIAAFGSEFARVFSAVGRALFEAALLWLTYVGLEPYVRRSSPDSLIGWSRMIAGQWRDPHVGRDVLVGLSAGAGMTLVMALHNVLPPLFGHSEPMPITIRPDSLIALRHGIAAILFNVNSALLFAMLGTVGIVAFRMLLGRAWAAVLAGIVIYTPVAVNGMYMPGTPLLDLTIGAIIISILVLVIVRFGLLAAAATLAAHFILTAPITIRWDAWWAAQGIVVLCVIAAATFAAASFAFGRGAATTQAAVEA
jgi:serine/threonine-protein kinase